MHKAVVLAAAGLLALAGCNKKPIGEPRSEASADAAKPAARPSLAPAAMPQRTPGLWEQKIATAGYTQASRICIDKAVAEQFALWGERAGKDMCTQNITPRLGGGWDFTSTCDAGASGKTSTKGTVTGDFAKSYKLSAESTTTGAASADMNRTHQMTLEANWRGPCPAGMQPGDMVLPNGMKINMMRPPSG